MNLNLCQYKHHSCFGCCGHTWTTKGEVSEQIKENTRVFKILTRDEFQLRGEVMLASCGCCKSLIEKKGQILCGLHPMQNKGMDYRDNVCEKDFLCDAFKEFKSWPEAKQKRFLKFIDEKNPTHYTYSMGMDSGRFLREFERKERLNRNRKLYKQPL